MIAEISFQRNMTCCKAGRVSVGLDCKPAYQWCCAWHHIGLHVKPKGMKALQAFAEHLLGFWPLHAVHWVFNAAGETSALALVCVRHFMALSTQDERNAYQAEVSTSTSPEFLSCFHVLCEAASRRP